MKRNYFVPITFLFVFLAASVHAQEKKQQTLEKLFANSREIYFTFQIFDREEIPVLTRIISIDNVKGRDVYAFANKSEFSNFLDLGYAYNLLPHPGSLLSEQELNMGGNQKSGKSATVWNFYPTYDQYVAYMQGFAADHPAICRLDTIGTSVQGRLLLAVKLSDSVNVNRGLPEFLFTSSIHGDETTGYVMLLHLIDSLVSNYGSVPRVTNLLNNFQIYINPLANPDGTYAGGNGTVSGAQRYNANGYDLNRNFPDPADGSHPGGTWQPETKAFMHYDSIHHFVMSANFHGGAEVLNYPWDTWSRYHADDTWEQFVCREYADTVHLHSPAGYLTDYNNGITNGYAWYRITGGRQDYTTYFHYGREVTMEISAVHLIPANTILNYWNYNRRSLLNYIEETAYGINGQVTDTATGNPLKAQVFITGHDIDNSFQYSNASSGWYYRPIAQGNWALTYSCLGYFTKTIHGINVTNRSTTRINARLVPLDFGVIDKTRKNFTLVYPNPSNGNIHLLLPEGGSGSFNYSVFDMTGKMIQSGTLNGAGEKVVFAVDLTHLPKGIYLLKLDGGTSVYENKFIIQ
ncbi:MAG: M14 family zinc carboxypeptidase [Bacteroidetes bacterium]|nr:M14 family zinc carboxypeptidase [Bacteroidota bacterium]